MKTIHSITYDVLSHHIGRDIHSIRMWHSLDHDLDLTPLELVLVIQEIEDRAHIDVPIEELEGTETVGDLYMCVSKAAVTQRRVNACA